MDASVFGVLWAGVAVVGVGFAGWDCFWGSGLRGPALGDQVGDPVVAVDELFGLGGSEAAVGDALLGVDAVAPEAGVVEADVLCGGYQFLGLPEAPVVVEGVVEGALC